MRRYFSMTLLIFFGSIILFFLTLYCTQDETFIMPLGFVLFFMMSIIITLLIRIKEIIKRNELRH